MKPSFLENITEYPNKALIEVVSSKNLGIPGIEKEGEPFYACVRSEHRRQLIRDVSRQSNNVRHAI